MKNLVVLFAAVFVSSFSLNASNMATATPDDTNFHHNFGYGNSFIFVENGITFSVFPDGEFDFYINDTPYRNGVSISFNGGYGYNSYLQYDDYGAVIQVMNTPVFYDYYGRVSQIGSVPIFYNNRRLIRIGGLHVYYNPYGVFSHCSGYINTYNRVYVYRPFFRFLVRPVTRFCMVSFRPYRQYYAPVRYSYYRPYRNNIRRCYAAVGTTYYYKENHPRRVIYKNDRRVSRRSYSAYSRDSRRAASNYDDASRSASRRGYERSEERAGQRSRGNNYKDDSRRNTSVKKSTSVKRSTTYKKRKSVQTPVKRSSNTSVKRESGRKNTVKSQRSVKKTYTRSAPSKSKKTVRKSSTVKKSSGGTKRKAPSKSNRTRSKKSRM